MGNNKHHQFLITRQAVFVEGIVFCSFTCSYNSDVEKHGSKHRTQLPEDKGSTSSEREAEMLPVREFQFGKKKNCSNNFSNFQL